MSRSEFQGVIGREADKYRRMGEAAVPATVVYALLKSISEIARGIT